VRKTHRLASELAVKASNAEGVRRDELGLHSDNGGPVNGATMLAPLQRLGIAASFSRPRVSDDNAIREAIFRTLRSRPGFPREAFSSLEEARRWVADFVAWYNGEHLHSGLRYVTPNDRHEGRNQVILAKRLLGAEDQPDRRVLAFEHPVLARVVQVQVHLPRDETLRKLAK
jgi:putative transposase